MKKVLLLMFLLTSILMGTPTSTGATGVIDFPSAYNLRENNYTVSAVMDHMQDEPEFSLILQGGFIPQLEAGIKISDKQEEEGEENKLIDRELLEANFKFQFVQEADNPAMAVGFIESERTYGYIVASKKIDSILGRKILLETSVGLKYDEDENTDLFLGISWPVFKNIKVMGEVYTYKKIETDNFESTEDLDETEVSFNIGGEFYTNDKIRTKIFWRENNDSFGLTISYIGIHK